MRARGSDVPHSHEVMPKALVRLSAKQFMDEAPCYLPAGVPLAHVQALNHAGRRIGFDEFAACSGWAFSFGYGYDGLQTAFMAVCGDPKRDGPYEVFRWLTERLGFSYEGVSVADADQFWRFVISNVDAGRPVLSEHLDGGLIYGHRELNGERQVWFDGPVGRGWQKREALQPNWVYVLRRRDRATERKTLYRAALARAIQKASPHEYDGLPQGLAALEAYRNDVEDAGKSFEGRGDWFCWAAFERLSARLCCARWLRSVADLLGGAARGPLLVAARHYQAAFDRYERYRVEVKAGEQTDLPLGVRARTPERIGVIVPVLEAAIAEERQALGAMTRAVGGL